MIRVNQPVFLRFMLLKPVLKEDDYKLVVSCGVGRTISCLMYDVLFKLFTKYMNDVLWR